MYKIMTINNRIVHELFGLYSLTRPFYISVKASAMNPVMGKSLDWYNHVNHYSQEAIQIIAPYYQKTAVTGKHSKYTRRQIENVLGTPTSRATYTAIGNIKNPTVKSSKSSIKLDLETLIKQLEDLGVQF